MDRGRMLKERLMGMVDDQLAQPTQISTDGSMKFTGDCDVW